MKINRRLRRQFVRSYEIRIDSIMILFEIIIMIREKRQTIDNN